jgi:tRNA A37 methylthiotransferase MiaB
MNFSVEYVYQMNGGYNTTQEETDLVLVNTCSIRDKRARLTKRLENTMQ